ncbi:hypothetical protein F8388_019667 [Cannabis sativa]|uniref:RNase H type-1 domain-containing protein n=1 Tax=Cannabis sativa TaxID=3483 RepID=A0A7J6E2G7_CANSA|nr:hypothetical protein F8388_019667 [Cannabis sativa]
MNEDEEEIETKFLPGILSVQLAEAAAIRLGLSLAHKWYLPQIMINSDCLGVINCLLTATDTSSDWGMMIKEILTLKQHFISVKFSYVPRVCNVVANALAIWSRTTHSSCIWTDLLPSCAAVPLLADKPSCA